MPFSGQTEGRRRWLVLFLPGVAVVLSALLVLLWPARDGSASVRRDGARPPQSCCRLGIAYNSGPGRVVLDRICQKTEATTIHLRLVNLEAACTHPAGTVLRDQAGRRYRMKSFTGLPACQSDGPGSRPNARFTWSFEPLQPRAQRITLEEVEDEVTRGLVFWAWRDVDVSHCGFR